MRILHLISSGGFYGAESMVLRLAGALAADGHELRLAVFRNRRRPHVELAEEARRQRVAVTELPCGGRLDLRTVSRLSALAREFQADILHSHGYKADLYALATAWPGRIPLIATCHNWTGSSRAVRLYEALDRHALRCFDRVVCVSDAIRERLVAHGIAAERCSVIANGVPTDLFRPTDGGVQPGAPVIGLVGRLVPQKGFQLVLECLPALLRTANVRVLVFGEGGHRDLLEARAAKLGIRSHVEFCGSESDMAGAYARLGMVVLPSFNEGLPMTLLEAMAAGVPVIASRVGAIPRVIEHGRNGLLLEPGNVAALGAAMLQLLTDPALARSLARAARRTVEMQYTAGQTARRYTQLYEELGQRWSKVPSLSAGAI